MRIIEISAQEYENAFDTPPHAYNSARFAELNKHKAATVRYLLFQDSRTRLGITLGERPEGLFSPFSAPFGGFSANKTQSIEHIEEGTSLLKEYGKRCGKKIFITLPPTIYSPLLTTKTANAMTRMGRIRFMDVNYHFDLTAFDRYEETIGRNARKNLRRAMDSSFTFRHIDNSDTEGIGDAYSVIRRNREEQGYPLRMTLDDVLATTRVIPADFFILSRQDTDVAAAQVFHTAPGVCQVIYWGDLRAHNSLRPMNGLAYHMFAHYNSRGIRTLDIGPSTECGIPNHGLCNFKESIGCTALPKFSFEL